MKVAIVVPGRLHAFDMARGLLERGNEVAVFTNYPVWAAKRFGLPGDRVRSFWWHGVLTRIVMKAPGVANLAEAFLHRMFGRWAARVTGREFWDVVYVFSGVAEELLRAKKVKTARTSLIRSSAHIRLQDELLAAEERRTGLAVGRPSAWMIAREEREYALADAIQVPSTFAERSFLERGFPPSAIKKVPLAVDVGRFRPAQAVVEARCARLQAGTPLRLLFVGNVSVQKGLADLARIVEQLPVGRFAVRAVGAVPAESRPIVDELQDRVQFVGKRPQPDLPKEFAWADAFLFPTIHDGFAVVLAQALAGALPILTTAHCAGPDLLEEGRSGWILPIRSADAFVERLHWCDTHRAEVAEMVRAIYRSFRDRTWDDVAADLERLDGNR